MITAYTICAVVGTTVLVVQIILMLLGIHGEGDLDMGHDADFGGDVDAPHDFDFHGDADAPDASDLTHDGHVHMMEDTQVAGHGSTLFFQLVSFRSIIAALAFFGIGGRMGDELGLPSVLTLVLATSAGVTAMVLVAWIMKMLASLKADGTVRIAHAIGMPASVYLAIPGQRAGEGKVTVMIQSRTMEYNAVTDGDTIPTGGRATIVDVINDNTLAVEKEITNGN